jgi:ABC-2 type transport system permease protein
MSDAPQNRPQNNNLEFVLADGPAAGGRAPGGPIADLSYRNYDGPLQNRAIRWWIVAVVGIRLALKKKGFWIVSAISLLPFVIMAVQLYLQSSSLGRGLANPMANNAVGQKYASQFFQAGSSQALWLFIISLMVGAGSIAADNQANALLVYLSKPITKGDYLLGKWMGIFVVVFAVAFVPALVMYLYCLLSYSAEGFLREEPWLLVRIILAAAVPAAVHASMLVGFSAWSKTPRMAGAIYAGFYFVSLAVSFMVWGIAYRGRMDEGVLVRHLSVPQMINGIQQNIYHVDVKMPGFRKTIREQRRAERQARNRTSQEPGNPEAPSPPTVEREFTPAMEIPVPAMLPLLLLAGGTCGVAVAAARARIKAVEVISG